MEEECAPLKTLAELLEWKDTVKHRGEPLKADTPQGTRTLLCHDMMGGYLEDRFVNGSKDSKAYTFYHWDKIDIFVYFSHHLVTIPPVGWINAAHRHNVKVLGTFITEWDNGSELLQGIKDKNLSADVASRLAEIAHAYNFDGWLMNIESKMGSDCGAFMQNFLSAITNATHEKVEGSLVLWYDSFVPCGKLDWQNELNDNNKSFFDLCDGIFLNYGWTEEKLRASAGVAGDRKADVYVGIDVFARNTEYPGGYETCKSVEQARKLGLSAAIFAPGWVYETQERDKFTENQCRLWNFPKKVCSTRRLTSLPIATTFCPGFGNKTYAAGEVVSEQPWFNLSRQQLQPVCQGFHKGDCLVTVCTDDAFFGGASLKVHSSPAPWESCHFKLFRCNIPLHKDLCVSYTFKLLESSTELAKVCLVLAVVEGEDRKKHLMLGDAWEDAPQQKRQKVEAERVTVHHATDCNQTKCLPKSGIQNGWVTRNYYVTRTLYDKTKSLRLKNVCLRTNPVGSQTLLLGRVVIEPADTVSSSRGNEVFLLH